MNELNIEILPYIFLHLPLKDIFTCKLVCKKWLYALRHWVKIRELVVYVEEEPINAKWPKGTFIDCRHSLRLSSERYLSRRNTKLNFEEALFSNLKQLYIQRRTVIEDRSSSRCIEGLNKLRGLEELILTTLQLRKDARLSLPKLKYLKIHKLFSGRFTLFLDTPLLQDLRVFSNKRIRFTCESVSLKRVQAFHFYPSDVHSSSLRYVYCYYLHNLKDNFLQSSALSELHLYAESRTYAALKTQKRNLIGKDVQLYFKGLKLDGVNDQIVEHLFYEKLNREYLNHYLQNCDKLASYLPFLFIVKYSAFEEFADKLPPDFLGRFTELEKVVVTQRPQDEGKFIEFLKSVRADALKLSHSALDQEFYSVKLLSVYPNLECLKIIDEVQVVERLDFEFIFRLQHLFDFCTNKNLEIEFVERAFRELPHFRYCSFNHRGRRTIVNNLYRNDEYEFRLKLLDLTAKAQTFRTFEELALELDKFDGKPVGERPGAAGERPEAGELIEAADELLEAADEEWNMDPILNAFPNGDEMDFRVLDNEDPAVRDMLQLGIDQREDLDELDREMMDLDDLNPDGDQDSLDESEADPDFYHFYDL